MERECPEKGDKFVFFLKIYEGMDLNNRGGGA
jgi:hypothetical protein